MKQPDANTFPDEYTRLVANITTIRKLGKKRNLETFQIIPLGKEATQLLQNIVEDLETGKPRRSLMDDKAAVFELVSRGFLKYTP